MSSTCPVRKHPSTLEASLFENNIPVEVFHNLIDTFKQEPAHLAPLLGRCAARRWG
jgi:oligoendopeptidase F